MSGAGSQPVNAIVLPFVKQWREYPAPLDDWGYYEGLPTPALSPLMPYNTVPWFYRKWMFDKLKEPRYSFAQLEGQSDRLNDAGLSSIISKQIINDPTPIRDHHLIAIRKQIEQLFAPLFRAFVVMRISDSMNFPPWFMIRHGWWQRSIWIGAAGGNDDLIGSRETGHQHTFTIGDATPTGSLTASIELSIAKEEAMRGDKPDLAKCDGSVRGILGTPTLTSDGKIIYQPKPGEDFRSSFGNYYVVQIEPRWRITERWRKAFVEEWGSVKEDYMSYGDGFHQINWGSWDTIFTPGFSPVGYAKKYALDYGAMWESEDGIEPAFDYHPNFYMPKTTPDGKWTNGPLYASVTRPEREIGKQFFLGSDFVAQAVSMDAIGFVGWRNVAGFNCGVFSKGIAEQAPEDTWDFPGPIYREHAEPRCIYPGGSKDKPGFGPGSCFYDITYEATGEEITIEPSEQTRSSFGGKYVAHCLGAKLEPYFRVTIMSMNGITYTHEVRNTEVYFAI